jgi:hypothetical protein
VHSRHADAEDTDEDFENRPVCCGNVIVCLVICGETNNRLETDDRNDCCTSKVLRSSSNIMQENLRESDSEHEKDAELLLKAQRQAEDLGYWDGDDDEIK